MMIAQLLMKKTRTKNIGTTMIIKQRPRPNEVSKMELVGDVKGCDCIIVDDMIDTGTTLCLAAKCLKDNGAENVYSFATHGLFNGMAIDKIHNSVLKKVIVITLIFNLTIYISSTFYISSNKVKTINNKKSG